MFPTAFTPLNFSHCNLQLLQYTWSLEAVTALSLPPTICQAMQANAKPAAAPGDGAPGTEDPALVKMSNQHTKLSQARTEEPAPTKLGDQHNTHAMPVRALNGCRAVPWVRRAPRTARSPYSSSPRGPTNLAEKAAVHKPDLRRQPN